MPKTTKAKKLTTPKAKRGRRKKSEEEKRYGKKTGIPLIEEQNIYLDVDELNLFVGKYYLSKSGDEWRFDIKSCYPKTIVGFRYMLDRVVCEYAIENLDLLQIMERMDRMEETIKSIKWEFK